MLIFRRLRKFKATTLPGGREVSFPIVHHLPTPSASHRRAPVRHRSDIGGVSENRASVAPPPSRHCHAFRFRQSLNAHSRASRCLPIR